MASSRTRTTALAAVALIVGFDHPATEAYPYTSYPFRHTSYTGHSRPGVAECM